MAFVLPKEAFIALAAVSWADGTVRAKEKDALLRAARECGVDGDDLKPIEAALGTTTSLENFVPGDMNDWQRVVTYAFACWLTRIDGVASSEEKSELDDLAKRLDLEKPICERANAAVLDVLVLKDGGRPDKFDLLKLEERLREKLPQAAKSAS
jgi:uncharacterized membrane protein YebE (DUF533 family)